MKYSNNFTSQPAIIEHFSIRKSKERFNSASQPQILGLKNDEATDFIDNNSNKKKEDLDVVKQELDNAQQKVKEAKILKAKAEEILKMEKLNEARKKLKEEITEKERLEGERLEKERLEGERLEKERLEGERIEKEKIEKEKIEKERIEKINNKLIKYISIFLILGVLLFIFIKIIGNKVNKKIEIKKDPIKYTIPETFNNEPNFYEF